MKETGIILAAGEGKRMKSAHPKVLHEAGGYPMFGWVLRAFREAGVSDIVAVVGAGASEIKDRFGDVRYAEQKERLGSGHAAQQAAELLSPATSEYTFIAAGDMPLLTGATIDGIFEQTRKKSADCMVLSAVLHDPHGYGRIVRDDRGNVISIVEHGDASDEQRQIREINASCYCVRTDVLLSVLPRLERRNAQHEYYLTDIVEKIREQGGVVGAYIVDEEECLGVNDRVQLAEASKRLYLRTAKRHMENGVTFIDPAAAYVDPDTEIGRDTTVYPGVTLEHGCRIGTGVTLFPGSRISGSVIAEGASIQNSVIIDAAVGSGTVVGPYAYLRPDAKVGDHCRIGDFVELKNCTIGDGTKVSHLTYIGDADFGSDINVGCGVVVVNYDGKNKFRSRVGDNAFVGCNTNLISPVSVGEGAYIAAGSTITEDVPEHTLAIARSRQEIKRDWHDKRE